MPLLVGLDVGTTSSKAVILGADGRELPFGRAPTAWETTPSGTEIEAATRSHERARQADHGGRLTPQPGVRSGQGMILRPAAPADGRGGPGLPAPASP